MLTKIKIAAVGAALVGSFIMPAVHAQTETEHVCVTPDTALGGAIVLHEPSGWLKGVARISENGLVFGPLPDCWMPALIPDPTGGVLAADLAAMSPYSPSTIPMFELSNGSWVLPDEYQTQFVYAYSSEPAAPFGAMCIAPDAAYGGAIVLHPPEGWLKGFLRMSEAGPVFGPVPDAWMPARIPDPSGGVLVSQFAALSPFSWPGYWFLYEQGAWVAKPMPEFQSSTEYQYTTLEAAP